MAKLAKPRLDAPPPAEDVVATLEPSRKPYRDLNFKVPEEFHRLVKVTAAQHGMMMNELVMQAINEWLERHGNR